MKWFRPIRPLLLAPNQKSSSHGRHFQTKISAVHERAQRLLNLKAKWDYERYQLCHYVGCLDVDVDKDSEVSNGENSHLYCAGDFQGCDECDVDDELLLTAHAVPDQDRRDQKILRDENRGTDRRHCVVM